MLWRSLMPTPTRRPTVAAAAASREADGRTDGGGGSDEATRWPVAVMGSAVQLDERADVYVCMVDVLTALLTSLADCRCRQIDPTLPSDRQQQRRSEIQSGRRSLRLDCQCQPQPAMDPSSSMPLVSVLESPIPTLPLSAYDMQIAMNNAASAVAAATAAAAADEAEGRSARAAGRLHARLAAEARADEARAGGFAMDEHSILRAPPHVQRPLRAWSMERIVAVETEERRRARRADVAIDAPHSGGHALAVLAHRRRSRSRGCAAGRRVRLLCLHELQLRLCCLCLRLCEREFLRLSRQCGLLHLLLVAGLGRGNGGRRRCRCGRGRGCGGSIFLRLLLRLLLCLLISLGGLLGCLLRLARRLLLGALAPEHALQTAQHRGPTRSDGRWPWSWLVSALVDSVNVPDARVKIEWPGLCVRASVRAGEVSGAESNRIESLSSQ